MILYEYICSSCTHTFTEMHNMCSRNKPLAFPCPSCGEYEVYRKMGCGGFSVPEGSCGNAANGYSSTLGDSENFKARAQGKPLPYGDDCKIGDI